MLPFELEGKWENICSFVEKKSSRGKLETNRLLGEGRNEVEKTEEMNRGEEERVWYWESFLDSSDI